MKRHIFLLFLLIFAGIFAVAFPAEASHLWEFATTTPAGVTVALLCGCPVGSEITDIPTVTCPEDRGQIQKLIFQRLYSSGTTKNSMTISTTDPAVLATWTALKAATDSTKVTVSPTIHQPEMEPGSVREYGGGNATAGGVPITLGRDPSLFKFRLLQARQDIIEAMKDYQCETLAVYLIDENGKITGLVDNVASPTKFYPIPVQQFFISDLKLGGREEPDGNDGQFYFPADWSDKLYSVTPTDFDALTDL